MSGDAHNKPDHSGDPEDKPLDMDVTILPKRKPDPAHTPTLPPKAESHPHPDDETDLGDDATIPRKRKPEALTPPAEDNLDADVTMPRKPHAPAPASGHLDFEVTAPPKKKAPTPPPPAPTPPPPPKLEATHAATESELDLDVTAPRHRPPTPVPPTATPPPKPEPPHAPAPAPVNKPVPAQPPKAPTPPAPVVAAQKPEPPQPAAPAPTPTSKPPAKIVPAQPRKPEPEHFEPEGIKDLDLDATMPGKHSPDAGATLPPRPPAKPIVPAQPPSPVSGTPIAPLDEETEFLKKPSIVPLGLGVGRVVGGGRFTLTRELGRGGMGVVWLARDVRLNREVALKLLPPEVAADEMALSDLRRETIESQRLSHPHIMRIHDLYETPGEPAFISMEYVDGPNLRSLLDKQEHRIFKWEFLRPLVIQLCAALDYAHSEKVIHRDLKPANLMLDAKGRLKLADFGVAATMSDSMSRISNREKDTSGTLIYMSPQQMRGDNPRASDDLYSLGSTLYELLTSKTPFYRGDIPEQVRNETPPTLQERLKAFGFINPIPDNVSTIIISCLSKDAKLRPPSARWIMEQLEASTRGTTVLPPGRPGPSTTSSGGGGATKPPGTSSSDEPVFPKPSLPRFLWEEKKGLVLAGAGVLALIVVLWLAFFHHRAKPNRYIFAPTNTPVKAKPDSRPAPGNTKAPPAASAPPPAPVPVAEISTLHISMLTPGAQLFTNNVPVRTFSNPILLRGEAGTTISLEARLEGYSNYVGLLSFPAAGKDGVEKITLSPMATRLLIESDPLPSYVLLSNAQQVLPVTNYKNGIDLKPEMPYTVFISARDYQTFVTNVPGLKAGKTLILSIGPLRHRAGVVKLEFNPPDANITLLVPGSPPVNLGAIVGASKALDDLPAKIPFQLVISKQGYISKTNTFTLDPGEGKDYNFGNLKIAPGTLRVKVVPADANISVYYSARDKESFGTNRDVPILVTATVPFQVVAEHKGFKSATNSSLQGIGPGETADLDVGTLAPLDGSLKLRADPADSSYTIIYEGKLPAKIGIVPSHTVYVSPGIPLQVIVEHKGYLSQTNSFTLQPGETQDCVFGKLKPAPGTLHITVEPADSTISIIYPGRAPVNYGAVKTIEGVLPDIRFYVLAEHDGYYSVSNRYRIAPGDEVDKDLGRLKPKN